jgi:hypothetical protein
VTPPPPASAHHSTMRGMLPANPGAGITPRPHPAHHARFNALRTGWSAGKVHSPSLSIFNAQLKRAR